MKFIKVLVLAVCVSAFAVGCACNKCSASKASCGMQCCADAKTDCAHCPQCSAKK